MEGWCHNTWHNSGPDAVSGVVTKAEVQKNQTKTEKDQENPTTTYHNAAFKKVQG